MLVNFPLCFVAFGRIGTHVQKYTPFRSPSASRLSKNLLRIKFIWLNFYTMKFSRFRFSVLLNVIILTQPVNIVKHFFLFHQVFIKSMENFRRCCFSTAWLLYQTAYALSRTFLNFFSNFFFPADPLPRGCERKVHLLSSDSLSILPPLLPFVKYPFRVFS